MNSWKVFVDWLQSQINTRCAPMSTRAVTCLQETAVAFLVSV